MQKAGKRTNRKWMKIVSVLLALMLTVGSYTPVTVRAEETGETVSETGKDDERKPVDGDENAGAESEIPDAAGTEQAASDAEDADSGAGSDVAEAVEDMAADENASAAEETEEDVVSMEQEAFDDALDPVGTGSETSGTIGTAGKFTWNYDASTKTLTISGREPEANEEEDDVADELKPSDEYMTYSSALYSIYNTHKPENIVFDNCNLQGNAGRLFSGFKDLKSIDFSGLDTSRVTGMKYMFYECQNLQMPDFSKFDTGNVTNMSGMFYRCYAMTGTLDLTSFDTSKVTDMSSMFYNSYQISEIKFGDHFNTSNVTDMSSMFYTCSGLETLVLTGFNTSKVTTMSSMFRNSYRLGKLDISSFDTAAVTDMKYMFAECDALTDLTVGDSFTTSKVTTMEQMFSKMKYITNLDHVLRKMDTSEVTNMSCMFDQCENLEGIDFKNLTAFTTASVTNMNSMFGKCESLTTLDLSTFDTSKVTVMGAMFSGCKKLTGVTFGENFKTGANTSLTSMFQDCNALKTLDLSGFDTGNVTSMYSMFRACSSLETLTLGENFNTEKVESMSDMFNGCSSLKALDLGKKFDTSKVKNMNSMFSGCETIKTLDLGELFDTSAVNAPYGMTAMFSECMALTSLNLGGKINTAAVTNMAQMFHNCRSLTSLDLSGMDAGSATETGTRHGLTDLLGRCIKLTTLRTPTNVKVDVRLPGKRIDDGVDTSGTWTDASGNTYTMLPKELTESILLTRVDTGEPDPDPGDPTKPAEKDYYKVTFNSNGGTAVASQTVAMDGTGKAKKPQTDPTKKGYQFDGWYADPTFRTRWDFDNDLVTKDITLYAKWIRNAAQDESPEDIEDKHYVYEEETRIDIGQATVGAIKNKVYDGKPYLPAVKVTIAVNGKNVTLTEGTDYRVIYQKNVDAGEGKAVIKGNGLYKGSKDATFQITKKPMGKLKAVAGSMQKGASGQPVIHVYDGSELLSMGTDYTVTLPENLTASKGNKKVTVSAAEDGNYAGSLNVTVSVIDPKKNTTMLTLNNTEIGLSTESMVYTGSQCKPDVTVKLNGTKLTLKKDYTVKYTNNTNAGMAYVTVTGKGTYCGSVVRTFEIVQPETAFKLKKELSTMKITYNGKLQKPKVTVQAVVKDTKGADKTKTLKAGKDYIITYRNNLHANNTAASDAGRSAVIIKGIGNYAGINKEFPFTIQPQQIKKAAVKGAKDALVLTYAKRTLQPGTDYDKAVVYGEEKNKKVPVTIKGLGDFTGEVTKSVKVQ